MKTLKQLREQSGMTVAEAARRIDVHVPTLWRWEEGEREMPAAAVRPLAKLYGTGCDAILDAIPELKGKRRMRRVPVAPPASGRSADERTDG